MISRKEILWRKYYERLLLNLFLGRISYISSVRENSLFPHFFFLSKNSSDKLFTKQTFRITYTDYSYEIHLIELNAIDRE